MEPRGCHHLVCTVHKGAREVAVAVAARSTTHGLIGRLAGLLTHGHESIDCMYADSFLVPILLPPHPRSPSRLQPTLRINATSFHYFPPRFSSPFSFSLLQPTSPSSRPFPRRPASIATVSSTQVAGASAGAGQSVDGESLVVSNSGSSWPADTSVYYPPLLHSASGRWSIRARRASRAVGRTEAPPACLVECGLRDERKRGGERG
ncbi:uncharacterized protein J3D65DRAFT_147439 [Phyllosticta citribraziliensis]|uniref:Uncharacterized protein n=1 Tax=Phyllosticta citribraziliensis TaxID=989973 RepID=A0ABR1L675_9PEZI